MAPTAIKSPTDVVDFLVSQHEPTAPTRPHAGVESQVANLAAGPFAAMLDRARDAIIGKG